MEIKEFGCNNEKKILWNGLKNRMSNHISPNASPQRIAEPQTYGIMPLQQSETT